MLLDDVVRWGIVAAALWSIGSALRLYRSTVLATRRVVLIWIMVAVALWVIFDILVIFELAPRDFVVWLSRTARTMSIITFGLIIGVLRISHPTKEDG